MRIYPSFRLAVLNCGLVLAWMSLSATRAARADDIVAVVDERGHTVYINTGDPVNLPSDFITLRSHQRRPIGPALPSPEINHLVDHTATQFAVDPQLVHAIIQVESEYNPNAVSRKGAMGLMQLVPSTAARFGVANPFDPKQNIFGGISYLKYLLNLFRGDLALSLAAYNAGENSVLKNGGVPSFTETRDYIRKVTARYKPAGSGQPVRAGTGLPPMQPISDEPFQAPIYRYVDEQGVVHFTN